MNQPYFGDNLQVLREHLAAESVALIRPDPPFNSKRDCNLRFKSPNDHASEACILTPIRSRHCLWQLTVGLTTNFGDVTDEERRAGLVAHQGNEGDALPLDQGVEQR